MNFNHVFPSQGAATLSGLYSLSLFLGTEGRVPRVPIFSDQGLVELVLPSVVRIRLGSELRRNQASDRAEAP